MRFGSDLSVKDANTVDGAAPESGIAAAERLGSKRRQGLVGDTALSGRFDRGRNQEKGVCEIR